MPPAVKPAPTAIISAAATVFDLEIAATNPSRPKNASSPPAIPRDLTACPIPKLRAPYRSRRRSCVALGTTPSVSHWLTSCASRSRTALLGMFVLLDQNAFRTLDGERVTLITIGVGNNTVR